MNYAIIFALVMTSLTAIYGVSYIAIDKRDTIATGIISVGERIATDGVKAQSRMPELKDF